MGKGLISGLISLIFTCNAYSLSEKQVYNISSIENHQIVLDGQRNESVWESARQIELGFEVWPANSQATNPEYKTVAYLFEDGEALYLFIDAKDPDPMSIIANYQRRDSTGNDDGISVYIDSFGNSEKAYAFRVNPLGGQADWIELTNGDYQDWDGLWESNGIITKTGYAVEIKIPLKNFRFPNASKQQWKFKIERDASRDSDYVWANSKVDRDDQCRLCQYDSLSLFENAKQSQDLQLRPYVIATKSNSRSYPYESEFEKDTELDAGVDLRWSPKGDHVINATINPDFSQVEADQIQTKANRLFSAFYDEKRNFFLEGEEFFGSHKRLVHTRNIASPSYGIKWTGNFDNHGVGFFYTDDDQTNYFIPGQLFNDVGFYDEKSKNIAGRYKLTFDGSSYFGLTGTSRSSNSYSNEVIGFDGLYRITEFAKLRYQHSQSKNTIEGNKETGSLNYIAYNFNTDRNWHWLNYQEVDEDFNAGLGFITRVGIKELHYGVGHVWRYENTFIESIYLDGNKFERKFNDDTSLDGKSIYKQDSINISIYGKNQFELNLSPYNSKEYFDGILHEKQNIWLSAAYRTSAKLKLYATYEFGDEIDYSNNRVSDGMFLEFRAMINLSDSFSTSLSMISNDLEYQGTMIFDENIINASLKYSHDFHNHLRITFQSLNADYNSAIYNFSDVDKEENIGVQLLYLYEPTPYSNIYIGYSSSKFKESGFERSRTPEEYLFVKFNHVLSL